MFMETLLFFSTFIAFYAAASQRSHILMMILSLEATSLTLALIYTLSYSNMGEDYMAIIILTFAAAETAAALALLTSLSRMLGSDSLTSCSFSN